MQRRKFIKNVAVTGSMAMVMPKVWSSPLITGKSDKLGSILPMRPLGKTGEDVTIFCLGGAHARRAATEKETQAIIETAIEKGVRLFDNAWTYGKGHAEEMYGKYLTPKYRDEIFLYTKTKSYTSADAKKQLEDSLRRMKTEMIDLWLMHEVRTVQDVEGRLDEGILEVMLKAQQDGKVRHLGFSGHTHSSAHRKLMERVAGKDPFVACQLPVNPVDAVKPDSFTNELVPDLVKQGYGVIAMKTLAHGRFFKKHTKKYNFEDHVVPNNLSLEEVFHFVLSQPVASICSGCTSLDELKENVDAISRFSKLSEEELLTITEKVAKFAMVPKLEYYRPEPGTYTSEAPI